MSCLKAIFNAQGLSIRSIATSFLIVIFATPTANSKSVAHFGTP